MPRYSDEPPDPTGFTATFDRAYTRWARVYDVAVKMVPIWRTWLRSALPHLHGPRVLEVSFGPGILMREYAGRFEVHGLELNARMIAVARVNLERAGVRVFLCRGTVLALPYRDASFDSVLSTMAFSGYPHAHQALDEFLRVLTPAGQLVLVDVNYPADGNWRGMLLASCWKRAGDLIRDMGSLFRLAGMDHRDEEIGGYGSVHLHVARKRPGWRGGPVA